MKRVIRRSLLAVFIICSSTASDCSNSGPSTPGIDAEVRIDGSRDGGQVTLLRGQVLVLALDANPSTGFTWEVEQLDTSILRQLGLPMFQPGSDLMGAGGTQTFRFQSLRSGETDIRLAYRRPWEEGVEPADRYEVRVIVR